MSLKINLNLNIHTLQKSWNPLKCFFSQLKFRIHTRESRSKIPKMIRSLIDKWMYVSLQYRTLSFVSQRKWKKARVDSINARVKCWWSSGNGHQAICELGKHIYMSSVTLQQSYVTSKLQHMYKHPSVKTPFSVLNTRKSESQWKLVWKHVFENTTVIYIPWRNNACTR